MEIRINDGRTAFYQFDTGVSVTCDCPGVSELHFATPSGTIRRDIIDGICAVPDAALQTPGTLRIYAFVTADGRYTRHDFSISVIPRPEPADYIDPSDEQTSIDAIAARLMNDPDFIDETTGPTGPQGEPGTPGRDGSNGADCDYSLVANALHRTVSGTELVIDDVSPLAHNIGIIQYGQCDVAGTPTPTTPATITGRVAGGFSGGKNLFKPSASACAENTIFENGKFTTKNPANSTALLLVWAQTLLNGVVVGNDNRSMVIGRRYYFPITNTNSTITTRFNTVKFGFRCSGQSICCQYDCSHIPPGVDFCISFTSDDFDLETRIVHFSDVQIEIASDATSFEPYMGLYDYTVTDINGDPVTLYGLPVTSGGNVTIGGQQYIADTIVGNILTRRVGRLICGPTTIFYSAAPDSYLYYTRTQHNTGCIGCCTHFIDDTGDSQASSFSLTNSSIYIYINFTACITETTSASVHTYITDQYNAGTPVTFYYALSDYTTEPVNVSTANAISPTTTWISAAYTDITYNRDINAAFNDIISAINNGT